MTIDLRENAQQISIRLAGLDFSRLWPGFHPYRFALYDESTVILGEETFPRTDAFLGNTSICFDGEQIAIWNLSEPADPDVLASKIVHEMFHAFQAELGEKRFANEFEAIRNYQDSPELLALRYAENTCLAALLSRYDADAFARLLSLRRCRMERYPYEYGYESRIEAIEGAAQFVEFSALQFLNPQAYAHALNRLRERLARVASLLPARIPCYDSGAAMLLICSANGLPLRLTIGDMEEVFYQALIDGAASLTALPAVSEEVLAFYEADQEKLGQMTALTLAHPENRLPCSGTLIGFNVYSARRFGDYIFTEYFIAYQGEEPTVHNGDFLFRLDADDRITELYRLPGR